MKTIADAERQRLREDAARTRNWKRWGPYLSERQWGTVREDYSADGSCWSYFSHEQARSRAYRWGEDGLLGITDRQCRLCFALALWNEKDAFLKERLFGLTGHQGNHGEDVKEAYFYLDSTPTHSYLKALYKYPQTAFPYQRLTEENARRGLRNREFELADTGAFDDQRYFDVVAEYAKAAPDDVLIRITVTNRGPDPATLHLLPTLWFRNTWSWGGGGESHTSKPSIAHVDPTSLRAAGAGLEPFRLCVEPLAAGAAPAMIFCDNETNVPRVFGAAGTTMYPKDSFHDYVVHGRHEAVNPTRTGTKAAVHHELQLAAGESLTVRLRLCPEAQAPGKPFADFDVVFARRLREADAFAQSLVPATAAAAERDVLRQAHAGLLWSKQFYHLDVKTWLAGDPAQPKPPATRAQGRNHAWTHLYNRDVLSMPDKWEYPWYAAWDLAFHMVPFASLDPQFAKDQLTLVLREWYMAPNGQIPAYEFAFGDVNPPVHAWACWRVYKMTGARGMRDRAFLARTFQKLLLNFTWWVNRKDPAGRHIFAGGFLGLDNIGVFDRNRMLPDGATLEQADATAWMAFYCATMLAMALELAREDATYEDIASKFFEHFVAITDAINMVGGHGLWDEGDGFYYDQLRAGATVTPMKVRSMVGLIPLFAVEILEDAVLEALPGFARRMRWFLAHRPELSKHVIARPHGDGEQHRLLSIARRDQLVRVLAYVLDEREFLSPHGIRSLSKVHATQPFTLRLGGEEHRVEYTPGESTTRLFGGNSNWRGPIWFPLNYLLIEALERLHHFHGDDLRVECPTGSGRFLTLKEVAHELTRRLCRLFLPSHDGTRPFARDDALMAQEGARDLVLFHEYFDGDTGRGLGASHQTGWTALVARCIVDLARMRAEGCNDDGSCALPAAAASTLP